MFVCLLLKIHYFFSSNVLLLDIVVTVSLPVICLILVEYEPVILVEDALVIPWFNVRFDKSDESCGSALKCGDKFLW